MTRTMTQNKAIEVDEATGQTLAEYVWLDGSPVAYVENGQRYQVHVDHLGTPKALTDSAGTTAWKASHSPFGKASITSQGKSKGAIQSDARIIRS